jgi:hypothetical protein
MTDLVEVNMMSIAILNIDIDLDTLTSLDPSPCGDQRLFAQKTG